MHTVSTGQGVLYWRCHAALHVRISPAVGNGRQRDTLLAYGCRTHGEDNRNVYGST